MTYEEYVDEVFADHHDSMGMDLEEIQELIESSTFQQRSVFLGRQGYHLREGYHRYMNCEI